MLQVLSVKLLQRKSMSWLRAWCAFPDGGLHPGLNRQSASHNTIETQTVGTSSTPMVAVTPGVCNCQALQLQTVLCSNGMHSVLPESGKPGTRLFAICACKGTTQPVRAVVCRPSLYWT